MLQSNIFLNTNTAEDESGGENSIFSEKPFLNTSFEISSDDLDAELTEDIENENPFCENSGIFEIKKHVKVPKSTVNWSRKAFTLLKTNSMIRSAPQPIGSTFWDKSNNGEKITLPVLGCGRSDAIKRISAHTLVYLMNKSLDRDYTIIDARFRYEYDGGHIRGARNISNQEDILKAVKGCKTLIFYCEYSSVRGPSLARKLRCEDRNKNEYPMLEFPEIYVLEGGYKNFFVNFPHFCTPVSYVQMHDERFKEECVYYHKKIKIKKN
ncbi:M-phase inducer phosphatase 1 [Glugoides intestinalis]